LDGVPADVFRKKLSEFDGPLASFRPEEGETLLEVRQRAAGFLDELTARVQEKTVVVCSHGDFLRALLSVLQQVELERTSGVFFDNASYSIVELDRDNWNVMALNQLPGEFDPPALDRIKRTGLQVD
jgi:broad specificity phosphatase PhoE